jgi:hypothetical protein
MKQGLWSSFGCPGSHDLEDQAIHSNVWAYLLVFANYAMLGSLKRKRKKKK